MSYANNKGADPRSLISAIVVRCLDRKKPLVSVSEIPSLWLAPLAEQGGLNLTWLETPEDMFSHGAAHMK